jgi:hypothetical protein
MSMNRLGSITSIAAVVLMMTAPALAQKNLDGVGRAIVTVLPAHAGDAVAPVAAQSVKIKVSGRSSGVINWTPLRGPNNRVELVLLIDGSARTSLGEQMGDITGFIKEIPANTSLALAYMMNGSAQFAGPFSTDPAAVLRGLHMPIGSAGSNGSPYICLSDLARHWPSQDRSARREVVMISDGVDEYEMRYDPDDPYVHTAINDSVRAGLVVYSIYWVSRGRADQTSYENNAGQNLLLAVTEATGGNSYWEGIGNPVSFSPYFEDLRRRLRNQYLLGFVSRLDGKPEVETLKVEVDDHSVKLSAPKQVFVDRAGVAAK